ncbi:hypothetical protein M3N55_00900 [Roseibaca sp. V10]|uniref:Uncharacterized protein n=1 Tax=Roseinatronobacter domitianus TaxID=2940293 RepID=A0ABT0LY66_9RHOB|nr:hypothetical protein [Roseibaca domitiana]MCL1627278.1 hypothetical protein [Roseibaca domitiana]
MTDMRGTRIRVRATAKSMPRWRPYGVFSGFGLAFEPADQTLSGVIQRALPKRLTSNMHFATRPVSWQPPAQIHKYRRHSPGTDKARVFDDRLTRRIDKPLQKLIKSFPLDI